MSSAWVKDATGHSSQELNAAYGYLWWLNRKGVIGSPLVATDLSKAQNPTTTKGQIVPGAPDDMFWALGLGNQIVQVDPGSKTVVVRLGTAEARAAATHLRTGRSQQGRDRSASRRLPQCPARTAPK